MGLAALRESVGALVDPIQPLLQPTSEFRNQMIRSGQWNLDHTQVLKIRCRPELHKVLDYMPATTIRGLLAASKMACSSTPAGGGDTTVPSTSTIAAEMVTGSHVLTVEGYSGTKGFGGEVGSGALEVVAVGPG
ncbi:hypothetical protein E2562_004911 [Oryza meyeriana var. granulata]|uniref:Uncharacterized protein n=1 Tax=Oryza meyeriana var. granulata TaxID=110450 RepID=A0A6G1C4F7_9ORYZ|nr:hypothetical protein E2562_004911 [Oryza meyeriana var. granulata]